MAKRTPKLEPAKAVIPRWVHERDTAFEKKFFAHWVLWHWADIVGEYNARNSKPQGIRREILHLYCGNSTLRNELRMMQEQIVRKVNNCAGQKMIAGIAFGRRWEHLDTDEMEGLRISRVTRDKDWRRERQEIVLSAEEEEAAVSVGASAQDPDIARMARMLYRKNMQRNKLQVKTYGWHPCEECSTLVPSEQRWCAACLRQKREQRAAAIRQVLRDIPWARCKEVQEYVPDCTPKLLNEQRAAMVQQMAARVDASDTASIKALNLVMLYRCLPPEQLTEDEIARSLHQLRFQLRRQEEHKTPARYPAVPSGKKETRKG